MSPQSSKHARWFAVEVQPHEPSLRSYLRNTFPSLPDIDDGVQESYVRLLRAHDAGPITYAKAFLFTTARNAALDFFHRRKIVAIETVGDLSGLTVYDDAPDAAAIVNPQHDLGQSVKVLDRAFLDDISPTLIVDTLKYVGGGQAGNINFADDRFTLRGFNSPADLGDFVDGFRAKIDSNTDAAIIDRLEIIKGPSAIFVANGPVGGVINKVTKSPVSSRHGSIKAQPGLFDANRVELDLGGPATEDGKLLYRVVAAVQHSPSLRYVINEDSQLTFKYFYFNFDFGSYNGRRGTSGPAPSSTSTGSRRSATTIHETGARTRCTAACSSTPPASTNTSRCAWPAFTAGTTPRASSR